MDSQSKIPDISRDKELFERTVNNTGSDGKHVVLLMNSSYPDLGEKLSKVDPWREATLNNAGAIDFRKALFALNRRSEGMFSVNIDNVELYFKPINKGIGKVFRSYGSLIHQMSIASEIQIAIDEDLDYDKTRFDITAEETIAGYVNSSGKKYLVTRGLPKSIRFNRFMRSSNPNWLSLYFEIKGIRDSLFGKITERTGYKCPSDVTFMLQLPDEYIENIRDISLMDVPPPPYKLMLIDFEGIGNYPVSRK